MATRLIGWRAESQMVVAHPDPERVEVAAGKKGSVAAGADEHDAAPLQYVEAVRFGLSDSFNVMVDEGSKRVRLAGRVMRSRTISHKPLAASAGPVRSSDGVG